MSQRGKRGNRLENDNIQQPPVKRRKGRPPNGSGGINSSNGGGGGGAAGAGAAAPISSSTTTTTNNNFESGTDQLLRHLQHSQHNSMVPPTCSSGIMSIVGKTSVPVVSANFTAGSSNSNANSSSTTTATSTAPWQARSIADLKISSIYNRSSNELPAELFRKDLISAMKLPDSEPLSTDEYWTISDQWKQEWEKGVQVPVNPDSLPEPSVKTLQESITPVNHDFKLPKNKYIRITKDENYNPELHYMSNVSTLAEAVCAYDLDQTDEVWLKLVNNERTLCGADNITAGQFERVIEELEVRCWDKIQAIMKNEEGLGIEYDENVICDVCRSPDSEEANEMVFCDNCNICVHQACYGITTIPSGQWLCRTCSMSKKPECVLCPNKGGAMKSTKSGKKWAHVSCALWIPEVSIGCVDRMEPITKISSIPQSRWALICVLCRERVGACIQCSVKTCKTAYHVTCAFQHGLEMRAIIEEGNAEDGVKLRSYCLKHSVSKGKKDNKNANNNGIGSETEDDDCRKRKRKDMTTEERNQARAQRLQEVEADFDKHVNIKDISCHLLEVDQDAIIYIYNYWILKRKQRFNRALIPPKTEDVEILSRQDEEEIEKRKMVVHLRQDLERVRNLCYMVNRREKLSRSFFKMREQIFYKQIAILSEPTYNNINSEVQLLEDSFLSAVVHANNGPSVYDKYYSSSTNLLGENCIYKIEDIQEKLIGFNSLSSNFKNTHSSTSASQSATASGRVHNSKTSKYAKMPYKSIHVNGITSKTDKVSENLYSDSSLSSNSDDHAIRKGKDQSNQKYSPASSKNNNNNNNKKKLSYSRTQHKKRKLLSSSLVFSSSDEDSGASNKMKKDNKKLFGNNGSNKRNHLLQQMEKEYAKESGIMFSDSSNDSEELITFKHRNTSHHLENTSHHHEHNKINKKVPIYSDSDEEDDHENSDHSANTGNSTDKEKTDNTVSDSQHQMFRTKAAMKEFTLQSAGSKLKNDAKALKDYNSVMKSSSRKNALLDINSSSINIPRDSTKTTRTKNAEITDTVAFKKNNKKLSAMKTKQKSSDVPSSNSYKNNKNFPTDLFVPQRQAAKKASENMRSNNVYSTNATLQRKDSRDDKDSIERIPTTSTVTSKNLNKNEKCKDGSVEQIDLNTRSRNDKDYDRDKRDKDLEKDKDKEREKERNREKTKPRGRPPKLLQKDDIKDVNLSKDSSSILQPTKKDNNKSSTDIKRSDVIPRSTSGTEKLSSNTKYKNNAMMVAYVPQRQAAKKAAEHIKSGLGKLQTPDQIANIVTSDEKESKENRLSTSSSSSSVSSSGGGNKQKFNENNDERVHKKMVVTKESPRDIRVRKKSTNTQSSVVTLKDRQRKISKSSSSDSTSNSDSDSSTSSSSSSSSGDENRKIKPSEKIVQKDTVTVNRKKRQSNSSRNEKSVTANRRVSDTHDQPQIVEKEQPNLRRSRSNSNKQNLKIEHQEIDSKNESNTLKENTKTNILQNHDPSDDKKSFPETEEKLFTHDNVSNKSRESFTVPQFSKTDNIDSKNDIKEPSAILINKLNSPKVKNLEEEIAQRKADIQTFTSNTSNKSSSKNNLGSLHKLLNKKETERQKTKEKAENTEAMKEVLHSHTTKKLINEVTPIPESDLMDIEPPESYNKNVDNQISNSSRPVTPGKLSPIKSHQLWKQNCLSEIIEVVDSSESAQSIKSNKLDDDLKEIQEDDVRLSVQQSTTFNPLSCKSIDREDLYAIDSDNLNFGEEKKSVDSNDFQHFDLIRDKVENSKEQYKKHSFISDDTIEIPKNIFENAKEEDSARETMNLVEKLRQQKNKRNACLKTNDPIVTPPSNQNTSTICGNNETNMNLSLEETKQNETNSLNNKNAPTNIESGKNITSTNSTESNAENSQKNLNHIDAGNTQMFVETKPLSIKESNINDSTQGKLVQNHLQDQTITTDTTNIKDNIISCNKSVQEEQRSPSKESFDTISSSNFFKNANFATVQESSNKDNAPNDGITKERTNKQPAIQQQSSQLLPDCEYDENTRIQSPYNMHPQNIWNENDLIPNRRSVSTSPSSISESNDVNDLKIQQKLMHLDLPLINNKPQSIIEQQRQHLQQQQEQQQLQHQPLNNTENVQKNSFDNSIGQHFGITSQFHMQHQQHMKQHQFPTSIINEANMMSSFNFPPNNQYSNNSVNLFSAHSQQQQQQQQQQQNLNQMAFSSPVSGTGMYPQTNMHNSQQTQNSLANSNIFSGASNEHHTKHNLQQQNIPPSVVMPETSAFNLGQSCSASSSNGAANTGAAFTSSSINMALTAALVSQPMVPPIQQQQSQPPYARIGDIQNTNHLPNDSRQLLINSCASASDQQHNLSSPSKRSNCSSANANRQFSQNIKSPQMHRSPGKSPRQMEILNKQNTSKSKINEERGSSGTLKKPRAPRGTGAGRPRGRGRGRGRGVIAVSQITPSMMDFVDNQLHSSIHTNLVGTPYDLDNDEDFGCNVENFKSLRDRRRSLDYRNHNSNIVGSNVAQLNEARQKFSSPTYHNKLRNSVSSRLLGDLKPQSAIDTSNLESQSNLLVQPVLPGPVDMRTYNSVFESHNPMSSQDNYNSHNLLRDFASGTADQTLHDIDEEVEKAFQSALKASGTIKIKSTPPQPPQIDAESIEIQQPTNFSTVVSSAQNLVQPDTADLQNSMETTSESIDSDTTNIKVSLSDSRNQLKLKIKGPLALSGHFNTIQNSTILDQNISSVTENLQSCGTSQASIMSNSTLTVGSGGTSNIRRMRKKELLRQYWNHDMNQDDSGGYPSVDNITSYGDSAKMIEMPNEPANSMLLAALPSKEDDAAMMKGRKKIPGTTRELRQLETKNYDLEQRPERRRSSACSSGSNSDNMKMSNKRRSNSKQLSVGDIEGGCNQINDLLMDDETPKLKIKIRNNTIETAYPLKKRLSNYAIPSFELLKRDSMNFRKQIMADYDKEEKIKKPAKSKSKKSDKEKKKSKKDKHLNDVQVIESKNCDADAAPKLVLRIGKRKPNEEIPKTSNESAVTLLNEITTNKNDVKTLENVVPLKLKLARSSNGGGYVIGEKKLGKSKDHDQSNLNANSDNNDKINDNALINKHELIDNKKVPVVLLTPTPLPYNVKSAVANKIRETIKNSAISSDKKQLIPPINTRSPQKISELSSIGNSLSSTAVPKNETKLSELFLLEKQLTDVTAATTAVEKMLTTLENNRNPTTQNEQQPAAAAAAAVAAAAANNSELSNFNNSNFLPLNKDCEIR